MKKMVNGEITAFLSLVFLLLLSLTGALLESASIQVMKNEKRADAGRATESVFAEYQRELLEEYDIFAVESSYETGSVSETNILNRLSFFGAENMDIDIEGIRYLTDRNGMDFYRQAVMYMKEKTGMAAVEELTGELPVWQEQEEKEEEFGKENKETSEHLERILQEEEQSLPQEGNPLVTVSNIRSGSLLNMVLPKDMVLSQRAVVPTELVSHRERREGYGSLKESEPGIEGTVFFNLYLLEKFRNAIDEEHPGGLQYELEYLLEGKESDSENLEAVVKTICGFRFAANYSYLLTDAAKQTEAETLAATMCTLLLMPEIVPIVKQALLLAWAYGEGILDVGTLLAGKRVPLLKNSETWQLSLEGLLSLKEGEAVQEGMDVEEGYTYARYLQILLLLKQKETLTMRALDLVELNMRTASGKTEFRADACFTGAEFSIVCPMRRGIQYKFNTIFQYH